MSYLSQAQDPKRRATAIAGVVVIHAAIGLGLLVGLTVTGLGPEVDVWDPFTITPDPKPTPPPPQPQDHKPTPETYVTAPTPPLPPLGPPTDTEVRDPIVSPLDPVIENLGGPAPDPLPANLFTPRRAKPSNSPSIWVTTNDYPPNPLRNEIEGLSGYRLVVGTNGRVASCEITRPSGNAQLDAATCRHIAQRARFEAATDETGAKVVGTYSGSVRWEIPD